MAILERKYQVFVSSTYEDLRQERWAVYSTLLEIGCIPVGMEFFPASEMNQLDYIKKMMDISDYYILIIAGRYGTIDSNTGKSYTENEFDYAESIGLPIMSFLLDDIESLPSNCSERSEENREKLNSFRKRVSTGRCRKSYNSIDDLKAKVVTSLYCCMKDFPMPGWVRLDNVIQNDDIDHSIKQFMKTHTNMAEHIRKELETEGYTVITRQEKRKYDLMSQGYIELGEDDKELEDALKKLGIYNDVVE